jgi:hypothetical protein
LHSIAEMRSSALRLMNKYRKYIRSVRWYRQPIGLATYESQVTTSASRKVSSRGRPVPLSHCSSSSPTTRYSSSLSCSSSSPDIRANRNGFSCYERFGVVTSFLVPGEAVARYLIRRVGNLLKGSRNRRHVPDYPGFCISLAACRVLKPSNSRRQDSACLLTVASMPVLFLCSTQHMPWWMRTFSSGAGATNEDTHL